jgi:murein DD-endopeptidase MepM/ murein hydrolase activator NlpD
MRLASAWLSALRRNVTQQLLIGSLAVWLTQVVALSRPVQATPPHPTATPVQTSGVSQGTIARGQSVFALLQQAGVRAAEVVQLQRDIGSVYDLHHVRAGQPYWVEVDADGLLQRFVYDIDTQYRLEVERGGQTFYGNRVPIAQAYQERVVHGVIRSSLYEALAAQGEVPKIAADLADILAWDIDFAKEVRAGDAFRILIQEALQDGTGVDYHRILAAEMVTQGRVSRVVYYAPDGDQGAYYDPDGRAVRRQFLRSPLRYTRISSPFSRRRLHPILGHYQPHYGIDYAAPMGTPVHSVADGVVVQAGHKGANGNLVEIRHHRLYTTYYLHLSRVARAARVGSRVSQGQVIGYVGSTGLATGPHLCFRLTKNGTYLDPLRHLMEAPPLSSQALPAFQVHAEQLLAQLEQAEVIPQQAAVPLPSPSDQNTGQSGT